MGNYVLDVVTGEAAGNCSACGSPCVYTDAFGRDNCVKIVDEREQIPEVLLSSLASPGGGAALFSKATFFHCLKALSRS